MSCEIRFPDGTIVRGAALSDRDANADWRDRGLYLDARWAPTWPATVLAWPDLGLPVDNATADQAIRRAFEHARGGGNLEVGCAGGLGRTGTVLSCMAVLAGVSGAEAVRFVRRHYDGRAVEGSRQEGWVLDFVQRQHGELW